MINLEKYKTKFFEYTNMPINVFCVLLALLGTQIIKQRNTMKINRGVRQVCPLSSTIILLLSVRDPHLMISTVLFNIRSSKYS